MKILVVDDELVSRLVVQAAVERLGHRWVAASDGEEAWRHFDDDRPDVLITDLLMPGADGLELCRRVRADAHAGYTYIILATMLGDREDVVRGMEAGADDYLVKPVEPFDLQAKLIAAERVTALHAELGRYRAELAKLARTDALTQLANRRSLEEDLRMLDARSQRYGRPYCVAICDVDHFKTYNDTLGHQAGDEALRAVAAKLAAEVRASDGVYRYGGEEFVLVLPEQSLQTARAAVERVRASVEQLAIPHPGRGPGGVVTMSFGIAGFRPGQTTTVEDLLKQADAALYEAKEAGRNRVAVADDAPS
ncbi:MAG TPA: diguanylate cyclase [Actinomycetota bacterium]|nr:diguanylate cyclase [Actinomycetota bacterium]